MGEIVEINNKNESTRKSSLSAQNQQTYNSDSGNILLIYQVTL